MPKPAFKMASSYHRRKHQRKYASANQRTVYDQGWKLEKIHRITKMRLDGDMNPVQADPAYRSVLSLERMLPLEVISILLPTRDSGPFGIPSGSVVDFTGKGKRNRKKQHKAAANGPDCHTGP